MKHFRRVQDFYPQIPQAWLEVLKQVMTICGTAYIAGGALRDLACDKPIKDVDIFINPDLGHDTIEKFFDTYGYNHETIPGSCMGIIEACSVSHFYVPHAEIHFELIQYQLKDGMQFSQENLVDRFDFGICQISCGTHYVYMHTNFIHALRYKVIKQVNLEHPEIVKERLERLRHKFPNFLVEVIQEQEQIKVR